MTTTSVQTTATATAITSAHTIIRGSTTAITRTESTTISATVTAPSELSSTSTSSVAETSSTSIQTSTNVHGSSSATTVISSEATSVVIVEPPIVPATNKPIEGVKEKRFNITFNVLTLPFTPNLQNTSSPLYTTESQNILNELNNLFANSRVNSTFSRCRSVSFRPASDGNSTVEAICIFKLPASGQPVDKVQIYHEFQNKTEDITTLGSYSLDNNSLFVDGYHESAALTTISPIQTTSPNLQTSPLDFNVTFIATDLASAADLQDPSSQLYISAANSIGSQLNKLFSSSNINKTFTSCKVLSFSPANVPGIRVHANCTFRNDSDPQEVNRVTVYHAFRDRTNGITSLAPYSLDSNSLYVNGYHEPTPSTTISPIQTTSQNLQTSTLDFNVTFIATDLASAADLRDPKSQLYISAANSIGSQLNKLFSSSNINKTFTSCKVLSFSPANVPGTRVHAKCTFRNDSDPQEVNRVTVYHAFRDRTNGITSLAPYSLDSNSLYVNDYHESISTASTTVAPTQTTNPFDFNVTFAITNLVPTASLQDPNSLLHKSAASIVALQMNKLFSSSKINKTFSSCKVLSFSPVNIKDTKVHADCTFRTDSDPQEVNRVTVYRVFRDKTKGISSLGTYSLHSNSLYVNDYHESILTSSTTVAPTQTADPFDFNVTFVITNLASTATLQNPNSPLYKSAASIVAFQMNKLFSSSKIKKAFSSCKVLSFRSANIQDTRVHANCTFRTDSDPQEINKVTVYRVFRDKTKGISSLGTYSLDTNSLFVNGYHESAPSTTVAPIQPTNPFDFNVTFTVTNLASTATLQDPNSPLYKSAASIVAFQMNKLFSSSKFEKTFSSCKVLSFSPANIQDTRVHANCTFRNDSDPQEVNRVTVYRVFRDKTKGISSFGTYTLDNSSLYVNDYHESTPTTTVAPIQNPFDFNVTFSITNLASTATLQDPNSPLYKSAASIVAFQLNKLFSSSNINKTFTSCKVLSFSLDNIQDTRVNANCTFGNDSDPQEVNRVTVYRVFTAKTNSISSFGMYSLDNSSLYVNGYHESTPSAVPPIQTRNPFDFNVTFVITSLASTANLLNPNSALYRSAASIVTLQLNKLFRSSKIKNAFSSCKVLSISSANIQDSRVFANCSFRNDPDPEEVNKVTVYREFRDKTKGISSLAAYSLDSNSLYVNGYTEAAPSVTESPIVVVTVPENRETKPIDYNITFTITNLKFTPDLQNPNSPPYITESSNVINLLNNLYSNSKIARTFSNCNNISFSPRNTEHTKIEAFCSFKNDPTVAIVDVYSEFRDNTEKITQLGAYSLNENSLYVNGYQELQPETQTTVPALEAREGDLSFELNFTIINRNFTEELNDPNSPEYQSLVNNITEMLMALYRNSLLKDSYRVCKVTGLRIGSIKCTCMCYFNPAATNESVIADKVKTVFAIGTNGTNLLGGTYQLRKDSLSVEAEAPVSSGITEIPVWGIILIVLGILLILLLIFLFCMWIALYLKKEKHGSYNIMQNPAGLYFPHQKY
ncbi:mucin-16-like [Pristis pectinata]|uniref:mucin-16-like n=1 Tax=Pristis pectinata TaxID=685728 RepID=UPI00223DAB55|nr:mucin-16-like [Pristis pectinata]